MCHEYRIRPGADSYGFVVGIMLLDTRAPFIPGDVGNASTYEIPVLYRTVLGATVTSVLGQGGESLSDQVVSVARDLEQMGVRVISSDCGFMLRYQKRVAEAVKVPVILSSLLQLPLLEQTLSSKGKIGVITASRKDLSDQLLELSGLREQGRVVIQGLEEQPGFRSAILDETGVLVPEEVRREVVAIAVKMVRQHPEIGPILLECSCLPPYAHAVQQATGRPVFDFITMINQFIAASFRKPFTGFY